MFLSDGQKGGGVAVGGGIVELLSLGISLGFAVGLVEVRLGCFVLPDERLVTLARIIGFRVFLGSARLGAQPTHAGREQGQGEQDLFHGIFLWQFWFMPWR